MEREVYLAWCPCAPGQGSTNAHKLLETLYLQVTGEMMPALERAPRGKPLFVRGPWHCSISHTRQAAFCALSCSPLGLDAEPLNRTVSKAVLERVLSPGELAGLGCFPTAHQGFLTHWVLKEAYAKYTGLGLRGDLALLDFRVEGDRAWLQGESLQFTLKIVAGHILAVCGEEIGRIQLFPEFLKKS